MKIVSLTVALLVSSAQAVQLETQIQARDFDWGGLVGALGATTGAIVGGDVG